MGEVYDVEDFIKWSNAIEGITRDVLPREVETMNWFINQDILEVHNIERFVGLYEHRARLRTGPFDIVQVGNHFPPAGGMQIFYGLADLVGRINGGTVTPFEAHCEYEALHPFTDCNGRSGRAIWLWQMCQGENDVMRHFLHEFYYQTLEFYRVLKEDCVV